MNPTRPVRQRARGFTLVELLVVVMLIGLLAGAVTLSMGSGGGGAVPAAERFAARVAAARDEAILTSRPMGLWISASGYGFEAYGRDGWQPLTARPFEGDDWGKGLHASAGSAGQARLIFDPLGFPDAPLDVRIAADDGSAAVRIAPNGDVELP